MDWSDDGSFPQVNKARLSRLTKPGNWVSEYRPKIIPVMHRGVCWSQGCISSKNEPGATHGELVSFWNKCFRSPGSEVDLVQRWFVPKWHTYFPLSLSTQRRVWGHVLGSRMFLVWGWAWSKTWGTGRLLERMQFRLIYLGLFMVSNPCLWRFLSCVSSASTFLMV